MICRHQLPAYSPISVTALHGAIKGTLGRKDEARKNLQRLLLKTLSAERVILSGSGTQALTLAIGMAGRNNTGRFTIGLPAYSCFDVATAAVGAGARVRFYDLDPETLGPDSESLSRVLSGGVSALVACSLFGFPLDWTDLADRCKTAGAILIEDAAQGLGSTWDGKAGGTLGDLTVVSLGRGKGWTGAGGGALLIRALNGKSFVSEEVILNPGVTQALWTPLTAFAQWLFGRPAVFGLMGAIPGIALGETHYKAPTPVEGISAFSAALASATAVQATLEVQIRRANADRLGSLIAAAGSDLPFRPIPPHPRGNPSYLRFPVLLHPEAPNLPEEKQWRRCGIRRSYPEALPNLPALTSRVVMPEGEFPGARILSKRLVTFPTHSLLTDRDFVRISDLFSKLA